MGKGNGKTEGNLDLDRELYPAGRGGDESLLQRCRRRVEQSRKWRS